MTLSPSDRDRSSMLRLSSAGFLRKRAIIPDDLAHKIMHLFALVGGALSFVIMFSWVLLFRGEVFTYATFWVYLVCFLAQLTAVLFRSLPFLIRYWLVSLALFSELGVGSMSVGITPNWIAGVVLLCTTAALFFGFARGVLAVVVILAFNGVVAWGWAAGLLPLDYSARPPLMDFTIPGVWARVLVISLLNLAAIQLIILYVVHRLNRALEETEAALARASAERAEKTLALDALCASEEKFAKAFRNSPNPMLITRKRDGLIIDINESFSSHFGVMRRAACGATAQALGFWSSAQERQKLLDLLDRDGRVQGFEVTIPQPGGGASICLLSLETVIIGDEECLLTIALDVTRQREAEAQHQRLQAQLFQTQKMDAIGQLAGGVAHDFNNILAALQLQLGLLRTDETLAQESAQLIDESVASIQRGAALTRQLLLFSRKQHMQRREINAVSLLEGLSSMLRRLVGENYRLELVPAEPSLLIHADPGMIEQVIMNLVVNARDAMPEGGPIRILIGRSAPQEGSELGEPPPCGYVCMSVVDEGCGISAEHCKRLYEPFFTTKDRGKGTGLGLSTAFGIVREHAGKIELQTELGRGSRFNVFIPAAVAESLDANAPKSDSPGTASEVAPRGDGRSILFAEDDAAVRSGIERVLVRQGYRVFAAATGGEALAHWSAHAAEIDGLITDIIMPGGISGTELAERLRREKPSLPIILASAHNRDSRVAAFVAHGCISLAKPFDPNALLSTLSDLLAAENVGEIPQDNGSVHSGQSLER